MNESIHWYLPPLILAISLVYAATRYERWPNIAWRTWAFIRYIVGFLGVAYLAIWGLLEAKDHPWWRENWLIVVLVTFAVWQVVTRVWHRKAKGASSATNSPSAPASGAPA